MGTSNKIARLAESEQVNQLLKYYGLSLTEPITDPIFGTGQQFKLSIYNTKRELATRSVYPTLDYLSQDLGFFNSAGYEKVKSLDDVWLERCVFESISKRGKDELNRYLQQLRPLLIERHHIYFYTTPVKLVETKTDTGHFSQAKGKRVLSALPMSVEVAKKYGCSPEGIRELAPQVAWLIPMLVVYRKVKATDQLIAYLDGWKALLPPQMNEMMHTKFVKHAPHIVSNQVTQLLLPSFIE